MAGIVNKIPGNGPLDSSSKRVKDYGNEPYFVKKANQSKAFLDKNGFPKELMDKRRFGI